MSYPSIDLKKTGDNIRRILNDSGISVSDISAFLGINATSVYKALRGDTLLSTDNLYALSIFLGLSMNDLIISD